MQGNGVTHHELKPSVEDASSKLEVEKGNPSISDHKQGTDAMKGRYGASCGKKEPGSQTSNADIGTSSSLHLICKFPHLLVGPAILFCLLIGLCTFGLMYATDDSYSMEQRRAKDSAISAADGLAKQLSSASRTVLSMAAVVKVNPDWPFLESRFDELSRELFRQSEEQGEEEGDLALIQLALLPFGRVRALKSKYFDSNVTYDVFTPELAKMYKPMVTINAGLYINGPNLLSNGVNAFSASYPIFFSDTDEDQSWSHPDNISHPTGCSGPPCYFPETRKKFWGFAAAVVNAESTLAGDSVHLKRLLHEDLSYMLTISNTEWDPDNSKTFVSGGPNPEKVSGNVTVQLPGNPWVLSVYNPRLDNIVKLRNGLIAMIVVVSFILSGLLSLLLLSSKRASVLLHKQLITNKLLHEEKESREALLGRQLDLIACFEQNTKLKKRKTSGQLNTLEQIATAKAAIADVATRKAEDIAVQEMLAEGSFGKVYKGKWRGTDVAVKIIMLPGNMSGREKREKMIIWEAAISSSLVHPNVCQTYHYRIKPVKETARSDSGPTDAGGAKGYSQKSKSGLLSMETEGKSETSGPEEVHSYEVQLVLEYCDRKSLRDALDAGLFMTPQGMNYAAQLDCAMDVAKAMLHLHCNNVLHLDLKTRNVLLASSGSEGKVVTCKVSDFGLSVRMDLSETHVSSLFQGTITHMAPEVLLKGTCSKASDVYAFGIVMWELYTGGSPFCGVPQALLGHSIVKDRSRPRWPAGGVPKGYRDLANACWDQNPDARPTFESILEELTRLRKELGTPTAPLQPYPVQPQGRSLHFKETFGPFSQPSLTQLHCTESEDGLQAKSPMTPSQAAHLEQAWLKPRGNLKKLLAKRPPSAPSQATLRDQSLLDPHANEVSLQEETLPLTASQAALLEQAWLKPRRNEGKLQSSCTPSTPSQTPLPYSKDSSALSLASPNSSNAVLGLTTPEDRKGELRTGSAIPMHGRGEENGLNHPQPGVWEGGHESSCRSNDPALRKLSSLTTNAPPDKQSLDPGGPSVTP